MAGTMPQAAASLGRQLNRQMAEHTGNVDMPGHGTSLIITTPVNISDLEESIPLSLQMQEELAAWFSQAGYSIKEIRKGGALLFRERDGELLLTRNLDLLGSTKAESAAIVVGTYIITPQNIRFNIRMMETASNDVLGAASVTVPLNAELRGLLGARARTPYFIEPSIVNRLP